MTRFALPPFLRSREVAFLALVFVVSRLLVLAIGFRFDVGGIVAAIQNIDPSLMRTRLAESLWYMHGQPPLWNALVGLSLVVFPQHWPQVWHVIFIGLGLAETLALFALLLELRVPGRAAVAIVTVFMIAPAVLSYENSFFYDYPTLVLLTVTALAVARFARVPTVGRGLLAFGGAAALVLARTIFQWPWLAAVVIVLLIACRGQRRTVLVSAALPCALVLAVIVKTWALYGVPSTTSWSGMMLARAAVVGVPIDERRRLVAEGKLHAVSLVKPLAPLAVYERAGIAPAKRTGIPLLDEPAGPSFPRNLENKTYIRISRLYLQDDEWIIEHRPGEYLRAVGRGFADFFAPATTGSDGQGNVGKLGAYSRWFSKLVFGRLGPGKDELFLIALYVVAVGAGLWTTIRRLRPGAGAETVTVAFALLTVLYLGLIGNFAELGENYRFRLVLDPLALALAAVAVRDLVAWRAAKASRA